MQYRFVVHFGSLSNTCFFPGTPVWWVRETPEINIEYSRNLDVNNIQQLVMFVSKIYYSKGQNCRKPCNKADITWNNSTWTNIVTRQCGYNSITILNIHNIKDKKDEYFNRQALCIY